MLIKPIKILNYLWRFIATAFSFSIFGIGSLIIVLLIFPIIRLCLHNQRKKSLVMRKVVQMSWIFFVFNMCRLGLISVKFKNLQDIKNIKGKIIVANHPSLIDIVILIAAINQSDCIVKSALANNFYMKGIVKNLYIFNSLDPQILLQHCCDSLELGNNLVIFPEGSRSVPGVKSQISKGAAHISYLSGKDIIPIKINCHPFGLLKNQKWYNITPSMLNYTLEIQKELKLTNYLHHESQKQKTVNAIMSDIKKSLNL